MSDQILNSPERPERDYMNSPSIKWRTQKPNYDKIDLKYLKEKSKTWSPASLEKKVENLVKTWEMESTHKIEIKDWGSVSPKKFTLAFNGGKEFDLEDNIKMGSYNMGLMTTMFYDATKISNDQSHDLFHSCFPGGFAWELIELFSGPPKVAFSWRHWGDFEGDYQGNPPTGERLELRGFTIATVDKDLKVEKLEVWYDPNPMLAKLKGVDGPCGSKCPLGSAYFK